jgi:FAD/FMN-containing dehydrogenase
MKLMMELIVLGTGEHGVSIGKNEYLVEELGEGTVQLMKTIKKAIDPLGLSILERSVFSYCVALES